MNDKGKADELSRSLDAMLRGEDAADLGADEEVQALSEVGRSLYDIDPQPGPVHRAAVERLVQAHRADIRRAVTDAREVPMSSSDREQSKVAGRRLPSWLVPAAVGGLALLFVCALLVIGGGGAAWWLLRDKGQEPVIADLPTATTETTVATKGVLPDPTHTLAPEPVDVAPARLGSARGVVEVQGKDGNWNTAGMDQVLQAGLRVRTGALSSAEIIFYDGSVATLGPDTELSLDELDPGPEGARVVEMTQWLGESTHDVVPAAAEGARYVVNTPNGTGEAKGTVFHVSVTPVLVAQFIVDEGAVAVTNLNVTVLVVAGQLTVIPVGEPPSEPVFRVVGEGQVTEKGETTWVIAGQTFDKHDATVIIGDPQVGDWVLVEGHLMPEGTRIADRIVLLHRSLADRFTISGEVESIGDETWIVAGQTISVTGTTEIDDDILVGELVRVEGTIDAEGTLLAETIRRLAEDPSLSFYFVGVVQEMEEDAWTISGVTVAVDEETETDDDLEEGDLVVVRGEVGEGDTWLARSIVRLSTQERRFEFTGEVKEIAEDGTWTVSGVSFQTKQWTEIEEGIAVGSRVKVEGHILLDGTWVADEIELVDEDEELSFEFVGTVDQIEPSWWVVSGISLTVNADTEKQGEIEEGDLVKVEGRITPEGEWVATEIKPVSQVIGSGCIKLVAVVLEAQDEAILLPNGVDIPLEDSIIVVGDLTAGAVIEMWVCVDNEGGVYVVSIVVIYYLNPDDIVIVVPPVVPPQEQQKVLICHKPLTKPQTKAVPPEAVPGHLGHGDRLGPCP